MSSTHAAFDTASFPQGLSQTLGKYWWVLLLRGLVAILFGGLAYLWPGLTLLTLILLWGFYSILDGVLALSAAIFGRPAPIAPRWWLAIVGIAGVGAGVVAFALPGVTAEVLLLFIAAWALVVGVFQIIGAIALRKEIRGEWMLILCGLVAVLFGVALILQPAAGALALVWMIGFFAIFYGLLLVALAFRVKGLKQAN